MELVNNNKVLNVGVQRFDDDHNLLIEMTNKLHDAIKTGNGQEVILSIFLQLEDFAVRHFQSEEELMEKTGYSGLDQHRQAHRSILKRLNEIQTLSQRGDIPIQLQVMQFLLDWLGTHVKDEDKLYGPFLNSKGIY